MINLKTKKILILSLAVIVLDGCSYLNTYKPKIINPDDFDFKPTAVMTVPNKDRIDILDMVTKPTGIAVNPEQNLIMVSNYNSGNISFYSRNTDPAGDSVIKELGVVGNGSKPDGVVFNPNKEIKEAYAIYQGDSKMVVLDTRDKNTLPKVINNYDLKGYSPKEITVTKDGSKIYITDNLSGKLIILKRDKHSFIKTDIPLIENLAQVLNKDSLLLDGMFIDEAKTMKNSKYQEIKFGSDRLFIASPAQDSIIVVKDDKVETTISLKEINDSESSNKNKIEPKNMVIYRNLEKNIEKLYVVSYFASIVSVIDPKTLKLIKTIPLTQNPNTKDGYNPIGIGTGILASKEDVIYIANSSGLAISMIDPLTDSLKRNIGTVHGCNICDPLGEFITLGVKTNY